MLEWKPSPWTLFFMEFLPDWVEVCASYRQAFDPGVIAKLLVYCSLAPFMVVYKDRGERRQWVLSQLASLELRALQASYVCI